MTVEYDLTDQEDTLTATTAIVLYEGTRQVFATRGGSMHVKCAIATRHNITMVQDTIDGPFRPVIEEGVPLDKQTLEHMVGQLTQQELVETGNASRRMIPAELLYVGQTPRGEYESLVWYVPGKVRPIWFRTGHKNHDDLSGKNALFPTLLFAAKAGQLRVYALVGSDRPTEDTVLHYAPFYNLNSIGAMCAGTINLPDSLHPDKREGWEIAFFESHFTHSNYSVGRNWLDYPGGHLKLWKDSVAYAEKPLASDTQHCIAAHRFFSKDTLVPALTEAHNTSSANLTVGRLIEKL